jgi:hypothetical protein
LHTWVSLLSSMARTARAVVGNCLRTTKLFLIDCQQMCGEISKRMQGGKPLES